MSKLFKLSFLSFVVVGILYADDVYEYNNDFENAKELSEEGIYNLYAGDDDFFKFHLKAGALFLNMEPLGGKDLNMVLYNSNKDVIGGNFQPNIEEIVTHINSEGDYYVKIFPTDINNNKQNYKLTFKTSISTSEDDSYEDNDNILTAKTINANSSLENLVLKDEDWYKIKLYSGKFHLDADNVGSMELYDSHFVRMYDSTNKGSTNWDVEILQEGDYYIGLYGATNGFYKLNLSSATGDSGWIKELDFGPIRSVPVTLYDIDSDGEDEIFVATSKTLDSALNEIKPAGLICLEKDGSIKWTQTFPAISFADIQTNKLYNTTSVSTPPVFSDIDDDGEIDIVVGVGGDTYSEAGENVVGQPGDKGGVYALDLNGKIKWFHESLDIIGGNSNKGDKRPDGVYGTPIVYDINNDGKKEIIYNSWDQSTWILNAKDGTKILNINLLDTIWSTPAIADLNQDGEMEILVSADITQNSDAKTATGGLFHVISPDGQQRTSGFDSFIGNSSYVDLKGKFEEQVLWSSPTTADIDGDGFLEIIYGTGNFFHDTRGSFIRIWGHDGSNKFKISTVGRTFSSPLVADIDSDGDLEIISTTLDGYVFAFDHNANQLFGTQTQTFNGLGNAPSVGPIFSSPIAVDLNGDGKLEIIYSQGAQMVVVDHMGKQINDFLNATYIFKEYKGTPAIKDIDGDGKLDIISGGTNDSKDSAVVYRWENSFANHSFEFKNAKYQVNQSYTAIENFVKRFYKTVLERDADVRGLQHWVDTLSSGVEAGDNVANGFIFSIEFTSRGLSEADYIKVLYRAFFNREADSGGFNNWMNELNVNKISRAEVLNGFIYSTEFKNLCNSFGILATKKK